jgi:hypothetical protein
MGEKLVQSGHPGRKQDGTKGSFFINHKCLFWPLCARLTWCRPIWKKSMAQSTLNVGAFCVSCFKGSWEEGKKAKSHHNFAAPFFAETTLDRNEKLFWYNGSIKQGLIAEKSWEMYFYKHLVEFSYVKYVDLLSIRCKYWYKLVQLDGMILFIHMKKWVHIGILLQV